MGQYLRRAQFVRSRGNTSVHPYITIMAGARIVVCRTITNLGGPKSDKSLSKNAFEPIRNCENLL